MGDDQFFLLLPSLDGICTTCTHGRYRFHIDQGPSIKLKYTISPPHQVTWTVPYSGSCFDIFSETIIKDIQYFLLINY